MIELIPAIDIIDGKCVRLSQGDYNTQKVYNENPVEVAKEFEAHGIHRLHIVDLDGAVSRHVVNYRVLDQIASRTSLVIDFGGGRRWYSKIKKSTRYKETQRKETSKRKKRSVTFFSSTFSFSGIASRFP